MHELLKVENTEDLLKDFFKVGEHLYSKKKIEILEPDDKDINIVFMMGGHGSRLLHVTNDKYSKHMIPVNGLPLSRYTFDMWIKNGFKKFSFLIDNTHRGDSIKEYYGDGSKFGANIKYSVEKEKLGSGGALKNAIESGVLADSFINHFPDDEIVGYDNFPSDFYRIVYSAFKAGYWIVILCVPGALYPYGEVVDDGENVIDFVEKPFIKKDSNTGIVAIHKDAFPYILKLESHKEVKMERTFFKELAKKGKMFKVLMPTEMWIPVNDEPTLRKFEEIVQHKNNS